MEIIGRKKEQVILEKLLESRENEAFYQANSVNVRKTRTPMNRLM